MGVPSCPCAASNWAWLCVHCPLMHSLDVTFDLLFHWPGRSLPVWWRTQEEWRAVCLEERLSVCVEVDLLHPHRKCGCGGDVVVDVIVQVRELPVVG